MTNKEKEVIYNDTRYYVITWKGGKIFTKFALIERRKKQIEKLFKGIEYHCRPCSYTEYFMNYVSLKHRSLRSYVKWRCERWKEVIYFDEEGHLHFKEREENYD